MALSNTHVSIPLVASTIAVDSGHLGVLIASAAIGGTNSYIEKYAAYLTLAFYLEENKGAHAGRNDGYLIPGAEPFWNMWSNKIPARWFCDAGNGFSLNLRLPRNSENQKGGYELFLTDFRSYEHSKNVHEKPLLMLGDLSIWEGQTIDVTARFDKKQLDLSTANRTGGPITHYLLRFTIGATDYISNIIPIDNSGVDVPTVQLTPVVNTQITITPFLLPTNVDTGRVMVPAAFYRSDAPGGTNVITVIVKHYPIAHIDSSSIYQLPLYDYPFVDDPNYTEGEIVFVDSNDNPTEVKVTGSGNLVTRLRIRGDVYAPGKYFNFAMYQNGLKVSGDHQVLVRFDQVFANITFAINLATALAEGDDFTVIATEV